MQRLKNINITTSKNSYIIWQEYKNSEGWYQWTIKKEIPLLMKVNGVLCIDTEIERIEKKGFILTINL